MLWLAIAVALVAALGFASGWYIHYLKNGRT
jgi:hypothetical protein